MQVLLWIAAGEDAWMLLLRDSRLTAALVMGEPALSPSGGLDIGVLLVATGVHFVLSVLYAVILLPAAKRLTPVPSLLTGAGFGALLYFVNLYGFTVVFPWFAVARGGITLTAHLIFGMAVMPWFAVARGGITLTAHLIFGMAVMLTYVLLRGHPAANTTVWGKAK